MKKALAVVCSLLLILPLCACQGKEASEPLPPSAAPQVTQAPSTERPATEATAEPTEQPDVQTEEQSRVLVSIQTTALEQYDPQTGDQLILSFSYETPVVYMEGRAQATAAINEYLAMVDELYYTGDVNQGTGFNAMLERAEDNYAYVVGTGAEGIPLEFSCTRNVNTGRLDSTVINVLLETYSYTGGPHGSYESQAYVFDAGTGALLHLEDLTNDIETLKDALVDSMVLQATGDTACAAQLAGSFLTPTEYPEAFRALLRDGSWFFDSDGLVIFSDVEELGPYAVGAFRFRIPYAELVGKIDERWMPAAREGSGGFSIARMEQVENGTVEILDKLTVMSPGQEYCLKAEGTVYDVTLSTVYYTDSFHEQQLLWACSDMKDCALQLVTVIPEGLPNLMLHYTDEQGTAHSLLLSEDGRNGDPLLVDDSIQAVG